MYVKLFGSILDSSIWDESLATRIVWVTMLTMADENGFVSASPDGVARRANIPKQDCYAALKTLEAPDIHSKSKEWGGRRIEQVEGGWQVLNYTKYREIQTKRQLKDAQRQARKRQRDKEETERDLRDASRDSAPEAEVDAKAEAKAEAPPQQRLTESAVYIVRCVVALNAGLRGNPHIKAPKEIPASTQAGLVDWETDGIPIEIAERVVEDRTLAYRPAGHNKQPQTLKYFDGPVREAFERLQNATTGKRATGSEAVKNGKAAAVAGFPRIPRVE